MWRRRSGDRGRRGGGGRQVRADYRKIENFIEFYLTQNIFCDHINTLFIFLINRHGQTTLLLSPPHFPSWTFLPSPPRLLTLTPSVSSSFLPHISEESRVSCMMLVENSTDGWFTAVKIYAADTGFYWQK